MNAALLGCKKPTSNGLCSFSNGLTRSYFHRHIGFTADGFDFTADGLYTMSGLGHRASELRNLETLHPAEAFEHLISATRGEVPLEKYNRNRRKRNMATTKKSASTKKSSAQSPLRVGNNVFIRTVTMYQIGRIVGLSEHEVLLEDASWVADAGRFSIALNSGVLTEVEPFPDGVVSIGRGGVIDVCDWKHALPRTTK